MSVNQCINNEPVISYRAERPVDENSNKARCINIDPLDFGYLVTVGCQKFAIEDSEKLINSLSEYLKDPKKVEKLWFDGKFLK